MRSIAIAVLAAALATIAGCASSGSSPNQAYLDSCEKGQGQIRDGDYAGARATFKDTLSRNPDQMFNANIELLLADCERELGNEAEAKRLRQKVAAEAKSPDLRMRANYGLGQMALAREDYSEAILRFQGADAAAREATPEERASLHCQTGIALQGAGRFAEARDSLKKAVETSPRSAAAKRASIQLLYPDHFAVQTGAFRQESNAEAQRKALAGKGFPAVVVEMETTKGTLHCVRVGKYGARDEAKAMLERIRRSKVLPAAKLAIKP